VLGRGHAEMLVPMIAALPGKGRAERIVVSLGPGSFTGLRVGLAAARALALVWGAELLGYPTLTLVAAMARAARGDQPVDVAMNGGHGEWFVQHFGAAGLAQPRWPGWHRKPRRDRPGPICRQPGRAGRAARTRRRAGAVARCRAFARARRSRRTRHRPLYGRAPDARLPGGVLPLAAAAPADS
jgi:tRNA threonylcarbamoyl adenosine modification protein YeaZ